MFGLRQAPIVFLAAMLLAAPAQAQNAHGAIAFGRSAQGQVRDLRVRVEPRRRGRGEGGGDERLSRRRRRRLRRARLVPERLRRPCAGPARHGPGKERDVAGTGGSPRPADLRGRRGVRLRRGGLAMRQPRRAGGHMVGQRERPRGAGKDRAAGRPEKPRQSAGEDRRSAGRGADARAAHPGAAGPRRARVRCRSRGRHVRSRARDRRYREWQQAKGLEATGYPDTRRGRGARGRRRGIGEETATAGGGKAASRKPGALRRRGGAEMRGNAGRIA